MSSAHPGKILLQEFMRPAGISSNSLAAALRIPQNRVSEIVRGRRSITPDTAKRLAKYFDNEALEWLTWQAKFDLANTPDPKIRQRAK